MIDERCRELLAARPDHARRRPRSAGSPRACAPRPSRWNFIAAADARWPAPRVMVAGRRRVSSDAWDGYPGRPRPPARRRSRTAACAAASCSAATRTRLSSATSSATSTTADAPPVATEFCGTSITSRGRAQSATDTIVRENPHIHLRRQRPPRLRGARCRPPTAAPRGCARSTTRGTGTSGVFTARRSTSTPAAPARKRVAPPSAEASISSPSYETPRGRPTGLLPGIAAAAAGEAIEGDYGITRRRHEGWRGRSSPRTGSCPHCSLPSACGRPTRVAACEILSRAACGSRRRAPLTL